MPTSDHPATSGATPGPSTVGNDPRDAAVRVVVSLVPEFLPDYSALADATGDDPGAVEVFAELASATAGWLTDPLAGDRIGRVCDALEQVAADAGAAVELVGLGFLDTLEPREQERLRPFLGRRAQTILDELGDMDL